MVSPDLHSEKVTECLVWSFEATMLQDQTGLTEVETLPGHWQEPEILRNVYLM